MKAKKKITLNIEHKERRKNPPRTAFKKGGPNPHAFKPGQSGNPTGGKPKDQLRPVSKSLCIALNTRAPDAVAKALGCSRGASWSQCLAQKLIYQAVRGDLAAANIIIQATEGTSSRIELTGEMGDRPGQIEIVFLESDGAGRPRIMPLDDNGAPVIEGTPAPRLPLPTSADE